MSRVQTRRTVSLSAVFYQRLRETSELTGRSMSQLTEDALTRMFCGAMMRDSEGNEYRIPYKETP